MNKYLYNVCVQCRKWPLRGTSFYRYIRECTRIWNELNTEIKSCTVMCYMLQADIYIYIVSSTSTLIAMVRVNDWIFLFLWTGIGLFAVAHFRWLQFVQFFRWMHFMCIDSHPYTNTYAKNTHNRCRDNFPMALNSHNNNIANSIFETKNATILHYYCKRSCSIGRIWRKQPETKKKKTVSLSFSFINLQRPQDMILLFIHYPVVATV